jgi:hypothetical protein
MEVVFARFYIRMTLRTRIRNYIGKGENRGDLQYWVRRTYGI